MYGNEVLPRIFSETAFADDFCFIQGHWLFLCHFLLQNFEVNYEKKVC